MNNWLAKKRTAANGEQRGIIGCGSEVADMRVRVFVSMP